MTFKTQKYMPWRGITIAAVLVIAIVIFIRMITPDRTQTTNSTRETVQQLTKETGSPDALEQFRQDIVAEVHKIIDEMHKKMAAEKEQKTAGTTMTPATASTSQPAQKQEIIFGPVLKEDKDQYIISYTIPGFTKEDIVIKLENRTLSVSGEKMDSTETRENNEVTKSENSTMFSLSFMLPGPVDAHSMKTEFSGKMLIITLKKK